LEHKQKIFDALPTQEKRQLKRDFIMGGWESVVYRNEISLSTDRIKKVFNKDPIQIRALVLKGNAVKVPSAFWDTLVSETRHIPKRYMTPFTGGIEVMRDPVDPQYIILKRKATYE
jgi:hypothetical protein